VTPTGFIPAQDQGYFLTVIQLPPGASVERTDAVMRKVAARILPLGRQGRGDARRLRRAVADARPQRAAAYIPLNPSRTRKLGVTCSSIMAEATQGALPTSTRRCLLIVPPPSSRASVRPAATG
jgi:multidrug efflux pump subunit AcrB